MPLFMDRHKVPGATARDAAEAHVSDLELADRHSVQFLSYWFDEDAGGVFCFASAPARANLEAVHRESHGLVPNEIIGVSENDVLRFLGKVHDPRDHTEVTSPFRAILFTDLEGSTAILSALGDTAFLSLLGEHDAVIRRAVLAWRGREVKHTGDGIMAVFDGVADALNGAVAIQEGFTKRLLEGRDPELRVRIGVAAGQPVDHDDDIYGATVVLASRLCDAAAGGQTLVSDTVHDVGAEGGFSFRPAGRRHVKGFSDSAAVFQLVAAPGTTGDVPKQRSVGRRGGRLRRWLALGRRTGE
jgi:class 3 adenylate cyclase